MYQRGAEDVVDDERGEILDFVRRLQAFEQSSNCHCRGRRGSKGSGDVVNHAGVFGVENRAVEVDQDGVICDPEDDLDSVGLYVTADVEAPVNLFSQG